MKKKQRTANRMMNKISKSTKKCNMLLSSYPGHFASALRRRRKSPESAKSHDKILAVFSITILYRFCWIISFQRAQHKCFEFPAMCANNFLQSLITNLKNEERAKIYCKLFSVLSMHVFNKR